MVWPEIKTEKPFVDPVFSPVDLGSIMMVFGFTIGFGYFVTLHAIRLTRRVRRFSMFLFFIWGEIVSIIFGALVVILYVNGAIPHSLWVFLFIILGWACQIQCLVQIIVNRISVLLERRTAQRLRWSMFIWIGIINIAVSTIWIPAQLQVNERYYDINLIFDRCQKFLYLLTDASLNYVFIRTVKQRLVNVGLKKYDSLVKYNMMIIWVSLSMDALIIGMMFVSNRFLYTIFHPLAFIVKLEIEMTMSNLIVAVARGTGVYVDDSEFSSASMARPRFAALHTFGGSPLGGGVGRGRRGTIGGDSAFLEVTIDTETVGDDLHSPIHSLTDFDTDSVKTRNLESPEIEMPTRPLSVITKPEVNGSFHQDGRSENDVKHIV